MSFKQSLLMAIVIFFAIVWSMVLDESKKIYPPIDKLIVLSGEISSFYPRKGRSNGSIILSTKSGKIELWSRLGEETTAKFGNLVGRKATIMVHPDTKFVEGKTYHLMHLEITGEAVVTDYKSVYDRHLSFMKNIDLKFIIVETFIFIFSILFIYSFHKNKGLKNEINRK